MNTNTKYIFFTIFISLLCCCSDYKRTPKSEVIPSILPIEQVVKRKYKNDEIQEIHRMVRTIMGFWQLPLEQYFKDNANINLLQQGKIKNFKKEMDLLFKDLDKVRPHYKNNLIPINGNLDSLVEIQDTIILDLTNMVDCIVEINWNGNNSTFSHRKKKSPNYTIQKIYKKIFSFDGYNDKFTYHKQDFVATILYDNLLYKNIYYYSNLYSYSNIDLSIHIHLLVCPQSIKPIDMNKKL